MKIAFLIPEFPCLSQTFILNQITGLIDLGHDVDIFAASEGSYSTTHGDIKKYNLLKRTFYYGSDQHVIPVSRILRVINGISYLARNIAEIPFPALRSLNIFRFGTNAFTCYTLFRIIPFLDKGSYDVMQCHFGANGNLGVILKAVGLLSRRVVTTFHGYDLTSYINTRGKRVYDSLFRRGDLFLPISRRWKDRLIELGCPKDRIVVHRMGVDISRFSFKERRITNEENIKILTVARLTEKKGVEFGILAVSRLLAEFPKIQYLIAGDGPLRNYLSDLINSMKVEKNVKLLGWLHQDEIASLMDDAHILLAPSVTSRDGDQEGIPVVLMEAMAKGLPVVSTFHSGIPELVIDGKTGLLAPERDADALAERLKYFIFNWHLGKKIAEGGRRHVEEHYDINKLNSRLVEYYVDLISSQTKIAMNYR